MRKLEAKIELNEEILEFEINEYNEMDVNNQKELERKMTTIKRLESYIKGLKDAYEIFEEEEMNK